MKRVLMMLILYAVCIAIVVLVLYACHDMSVNGTYKPMCIEGYFYSYEERACIPGYRP